MEYAYTSLIQNYHYLIQIVKGLLCNYAIDCNYFLCHCIHTPGVAACSSTSFVTSSLDGSLQTFSLDSSSIRDNHVSPSPVAVEIPEGVVASQGVASSETGLLIAVAMK